MDNRPLALRGPGKNERDDQSAHNSGDTDERRSCKGKHRHAHNTFGHSVLSSWGTRLEYDLRHHRSNTVSWKRSEETDKQTTRAQVDGNCSTVAGQRNNFQRCDPL
jgi:hypothetical protein